MATGYREDVVQIGPSKVHLLKAGDGEPVVVLHQDIGNPGWLPFHQELARRFTVYVPSHPGFGKSDRPDWARNVRDLALLHQWVLKRLNLSRVSLVGLGLGGWLAAELATMSPWQFKKLVLVGAAGVKPKEGEIMDQFLVSVIDYIRAGFSDQRKFDELFGADPDLDQLEAWEINREMTARVAWKPYLFNQALPHLLPGVDVPALVVWGKDDRQVPLSCGRQYAELLPRSKLQVIEGCGHYVEIERPAELAKLAIEFLGAA